MNGIHLILVAMLGKSAASARVIKTTLFGQYTYNLNRSVWMVLYDTLNIFQDEASTSQSLSWRACIISLAVRKKVTIAIDNT